MSPADVFSLFTNQGDALVVGIGTASVFLDGQGAYNFPLEVPWANEHRAVIAWIQDAENFSTIRWWGSHPIDLSTGTIVCSSQDSLDANVPQTVTVAYLSFGS